MRKMKGPIWFLTLLLVGAAASQHQHGHSSGQYSGSGGQSRGSGSARSDDPASWDIRLSVPGEPEVDYPVFSTIPSTSFTCLGKKDGYYADQEARCQVFRVCAINAPGGYYSFLCPNGTTFHQEYFVCDWWMNVRCNGLDSERLTAPAHMTFNLGPKMMNDIQKMITYPIQNPLPEDYPVITSVMQVYNPPDDMMAMFESPDYSDQGQEILDEGSPPDIDIRTGGHVTNKDSYTGDTNYEQKPIINQYTGFESNNYAGQIDTTLQTVHQTEELNLQTPFNTNAQQAIKITKQQYTYPSQFDKQYTLTVPQGQEQTAGPQRYIVNIPINIPAIEDSSKLVSQNYQEGYNQLQSSDQQQVYSSPNNNSSTLIESSNNTHTSQQQSSSIQTIPFVVFLLKPQKDASHNDLRINQPQQNSLTESPITLNHYSANSLHRGRYETNSVTQEISPLNGQQVSYHETHNNNDNSPNITQVTYGELPQYQANQYGINNSIYSNQLIQRVNGIEIHKGYANTNVQNQSLPPNPTLSYPKDKKFGFVQNNIKESLIKEENINHNQINSIDSTNYNFKDNNITSSDTTKKLNNETNLVTVFSAHIFPQGNTDQEKILELCVPKDFLSYLVHLHNTTTSALKQAASGANSFISYTNINRNGSGEIQSMLKEPFMQNIMQNFLTKTNFSNLQDSLVGGEEQYQRQSALFQQDSESFQKQTSALQSTQGTYSQFRQQNSFNSQGFQKNNELNTFQQTDGGNQQQNIQTANLEYSKNENGNANINTFNQNLQQQTTGIDNYSQKTAGNVYSSKFNKDTAAFTQKTTQRYNQEITGDQVNNANIQGGEQFDAYKSTIVDSRDQITPIAGGKNTQEIEDENYDQYRITSGVSPTTITDEENQGEFYSVHQQFGRPPNTRFQYRPQSNVGSAQLNHSVINGDEQYQQNDEFKSQVQSTVKTNDENVKTTQYVQQVQSNVPAEANYNQYDSFQNVQTKENVVAPVQQQASQHTDFSGTQSVAPQVSSQHFQITETEKNIFNGGATTSTSGNNGASFTSTYSTQSHTPVIGEYNAIAVNKQTTGPVTTGFYVQSSQNIQSIPQQFQVSGYEQITSNLPETQEQYISNTDYAINDNNNSGPETTIYSQDRINTDFPAVKQYKQEISIRQQVTGLTSNTGTTRYSQEHVNTNVPAVQQYKQEVNVQKQVSEINSNAGTTTYSQESVNTNVPAVKQNKQEINVRKQASGQNSNAGTTRYSQESVNTKVPSVEQYKQEVNVQKQVSGLNSNAGYNQKVVHTTQQQTNRYSTTGSQGNLQQTSQVKYTPETNQQQYSQHFGQVNSNIKGGPMLVSKTEETLKVGVPVPVSNRQSQFTSFTATKSPTVTTQPLQVSKTQGQAGNGNNFRQQVHQKDSTISNNYKQGTFSQQTTTEQKTFGGANYTTTIYRTTHNNPPQLVSKFNSYTTTHTVPQQQQQYKYESIIKQGGNVVQNNVPVQSKYQQLLSIQKQFGGSNIPSPFMKSTQNNVQQHKKTPFSSLTSTQTTFPTSSDVQITRAQGTHLGDRIVENSQFSEQINKGTTITAVKQPAFIVQPLQPTQQIYNQRFGQQNTRLNTNQYKQANQVQVTKTNSFNQQPTVSNSFQQTQNNYVLPSSNSQNTQYKVESNNAQYSAQGQNVHRKNIAQGYNQQTNQYQQSTQTLPSTSTTVQTLTNSQQKQSSFQSHQSHKQSAHNHQTIQPVYPLNSNVRLSDRQNNVQTAIPDLVNKGGYSRVEFVPAFGFAIDSDHERQDYLSAVSGSLNLGKTYLAPYEDRTVTFTSGGFTGLAPSQGANFNNFQNSHGNSHGFQTANFDSQLRTAGIGSGNSYNPSFSAPQTSYGNSRLGLGPTGPEQTFHQHNPIENLGYPKIKPSIPFNF